MHAVAAKHTIPATTLLKLIGRLWAGLTFTDDRNTPDGQPLTERSLGICDVLDQLRLGPRQRSHRTDERLQIVEHERFPSRINAAE